MRETWTAPSVSDSVVMEQSFGWLKFGNIEGKIDSRVMPAQGQSFSRNEI